MFSLRRLLRHAKETFGISSRRTWKRWVLNGLAATLLFVMLWGISALGPLRTFLPYALQITGWPGSDRTYLVLFQNDAELRATGGFITSFALIEFKNGLPAGIDFQDVYGEIDDHEYISPPYPMDILLEEGSDTYAGHSFRDANYNPDYPQAVQDILEFFHLTNPDTQIDGVFAMNFSVMEDIVALYEPLRLDRYELTQDNLFEILETAVSDIDRHNVEALASRKNIIRDFATGLIRKMVFSPWKWRSLTEVVTQSLNQKDLLVYFENDRLTQKVESLGWDGAFPENDADAPTDLLAVNVSNFGGMKSDRYITREVHYTVTITDDLDENGDPILYGDLEVTLRHYGDYNIPISGGYKGYIRAFLPMETTLLESSTSTSVREFITGYVGWGDLILLNPGEALTYTYRFQLNPAVYRNDRYTLNLIKQPGTAEDYYEVVVKTPQGRNIQSDTFDVHENSAFFSGNLTHDLELSLEVLKDETGPRIYEHEITDLNVIVIHFSEELLPETAEDPLNYQITDLDKNVPEITDAITIDYITTDGGTVTIYTRGMDRQAEEHFEILLRNIRDNEGNSIVPNPRTITVVQRLD